MTKSETIPHWLWRLVLLALAGSVLAVGLLLVLALGGISDPRSIGELAVRDELDGDAGWRLQATDTQDGAQGQIIDGVYRIVLSGANTHAIAQAPYPLQAPCTIQIAARQIDGPTDAGYGLWWGDSGSGDDHVAAVNGDGYLTIYRSVNGNKEPVLEWQVFPRIRPQGQTNTVQVDIDGSQILVRVNDEVAASYTWASHRPLETGFYVETLSSGGTTVDFDWLAIWQAPDSPP